MLADLKRAALAVCEAQLALHQRMHFPCPLPNCGDEVCVKAAQLWRLAKDMPDA